MVKKDQEIWCEVNDKRLMKRRVTNDVICLTKL